MSGGRRQLSTGQTGFLFPLSSIHIPAPFSGTRNAWAQGHPEYIQTTVTSLGGCWMASANFLYGISEDAPLFSGAQAG